MYHDTEDGERIIRTIRLRDVDLAAVSQLLDQLVGESAELNGISTAAFGADEMTNEQALLRFARLMAVLRQARSKYFSKAMFSGPAWDMLLWLYVSRAEGPRLSVGRLAEMSGAPPTTALRWLEYLEKDKLVCRQANPTDRRSEFVELTQKGRGALESYLAETLATMG